MAKIFLEKAIFRNVAPFGNLDLDVKENDILTLTSINGKGKTTVLSYIADAFFEVARAAGYDDVLKNESLYYRVSSPNSILNKDIGYSLVYLRFKNGEQYIDYVEVTKRGVNQITQEEYNNIVTFADKISFDSIQQMLSDEGTVKKISTTDRKIAREALTSNVLIYFPSDRMEIPVWLNNNQYKDSRLNTKTRFSGELRKNIEARSISTEVVGWILDVVLDRLMNELGPLSFNYHTSIERTLTSFLRAVLSEKSPTCIFAVGPRNNGETRLSVVEDIKNEKKEKIGQKIISPSFFHLSSGEIALIILCTEIIRQYDAYANQNTEFDPQNINGVVLIDEVDKHLHIKLQKEVLPILIQHFPNVQFIVSTHAPFFNMGASKQLGERFRNFSLDLKSEVQVSNDPRFNEVYEMMIDENERYKSLSGALQKELEKNKEEIKPLVIVEGKTDWMHLEKAKEKMNIKECDVVFLKEEVADKNGRGHTALLSLLEQHAKTPRKRKIIGIFDRDVSGTVEGIEGKGDVKLPYKKFGENVYGFCIPIPENRKDYKKISIEFYYPDTNLKKESGGKCLYFDNEVVFMQSAQNNTRVITKRELPEGGEAELIKKVIDENVGDLTWIHSKGRFAELVAGKIAGVENFANDFDFSNFHLIFNKIQEIINPVPTKSEEVDEDPPQTT